MQVPEFRVAYTVTTDKLDSLYKRLKPQGVTMTALLAKAAGVALAKHPLLYAGAHTLPSPFPLFKTISPLPSSPLTLIALPSFSNLRFQSLNWCNKGSGAVMIPHSVWPPPLQFSRFDPFQRLVIIMQRLRGFRVYACRGNSQDRFRDFGS